MAKRKYRRRQPITIKEHAEDLQGSTIIVQPFMKDDAKRKG